MKKKMPTIFRTLDIQLKVDSDSDGVPDYKDCKPLNPRKQHTKRWENQLMRKERFKREHASEVLTELGRGWTEEKALTRMMKKPSSNLERLMTRHQRISINPNAVAFSADDILRTKEVREYIKSNNLKDLGKEIRL